MSESKIHAALVSRIEGLGIALPIVWENKRTEANGPHVRVHVLPGQHTQAANGFDYSDGLIQFDFYLEPDTGTRDGTDYADLIRSHFRRGASCKFDGQVVRFSDFSRRPGRIEDGYYRVSCDVYWSARIYHF